MIELIPAIDIIDGRCVRLSQGDYARQRTYDASPAEMGAAYAAAGIRRLHLVDLDGAKAAAPQNLDTLRALAALPLDIEWGGGIKSAAALQAVFDAGARYAIIGSVAAQQPELMEAWLARYGGERIILGADVRGGRIAVNGWQEESPLTIDALIERFLPCGLTQLICTDISKDGMLQGPNQELYTRLQSAYPTVDITVSGGIGSMDDIRALDALGLRKVIIGKAIYENRITLNELQTWSQNASSPASM